MRRLAHLVAVLLVAMAMTGSSAAARDIEWCAEDPVFSVLGSQFRLTTTVATSASDVTGLTYVVTLPSNAEGSAAVQYPQGRRLPATVELRYTGAAWSGDGTFSVSAAVTASASTDAAVTVELAGPSVAAASFGGSTNKPVRARFDVSTR